MPQKIKPAVCLVLHAHMPFVIGHGHWPHGEVWLMEAVSGVYLPILQLLDRLYTRRVPVSFTIGITPVLLLQLSDHGFQKRLVNYLDQQIVNAEKDRQDSDLQFTAKYWIRHYHKLKQQYLSLNGDIPKAFAKAQERGQIEILTGPVTHPYSALLSSDRTLEHQIRLGQKISRKVLGECSTGIWLPECSHRPQMHRIDPISGGPPKTRFGVDRILERCGVSHYFVESTLFENARSEGVIQRGIFKKCSWDAVNDNPEYMWRSVLEPHLVNSTGRNSRIAAFARHPEACAQVWSADGGYPGDGSYLEFHKRKDTQGHRYWRVTDRGIGLGGKKLYHPQTAALTARAHAVDYLRKIEYWLKSHPFGRNATLSLCFDAELFGHWWFEGPLFLEHLLQLLGQHPQIQTCTTDHRLTQVKLDKVVWLGEGSWGAGGDHQVWWNEQTHWMWQTIHRSEEKFHSLTDAIQSSSKVTKKAAELYGHLQWAFLLLQASDWIFVITTKGAVDYGYERFCEHHKRFEALSSALECALSRRKPTPRVSLLVQEAVLSQNGRWLL